MATTALTTAYNQVANFPTGAALINALENSPILYGGLNGSLQHHLL